VPVAPRAATVWPSDDSGNTEGVAGKAGFGADRRLREAADFKAVFSLRRVLRGECFNLHYRPNGGPSARLGLVIAKKLARRSVWRNAIKRVGREAFRHKRADLPAMDLILRLAQPVATADAAARRAWRAEIDVLLEKLPR
jgi:ribonuclease P protein component